MLITANADRVLRLCVDSQLSKVPSFSEDHCSDSSLFLIWAALQVEMTLWSGGYKLQNVGPRKQRNKKESKSLVIQPLKRDLLVGFVT